MFARRRPCPACLRQIEAAGAGYRASREEGVHMKAVVFNDVGDIRLEDVPEPKLQEPTDAIVRLTASAICGTDLHMVRGTLPGMKAGTILGHEGVGVVEALGSQVRNLAVGDRVIIPSTIARGSCSYCSPCYSAQVGT